MRVNVEAESPEDHFRKSITTFSLLYAKWNENKIYQPSHQNRFGATVGSIYYTLVSSSNKTDRHDIAEILLKVALNTIKN